MSVACWISKATRAQTHACVWAPTYTCTHRPTRANTQRGICNTYYGNTESVNAPHCYIACLVSTACHTGRTRKELSSVYGGRPNEKPITASPLSCICKERISNIGQKGSLFSSVHPSKCRGQFKSNRHYFFIAPTSAR